MTEIIVTPKWRKYVRPVVLGIIGAVLLTAFVLHPVITPVVLAALLVAFVAGMKTLLRRGQGYERERMWNGARVTYRAKFNHPVPQMLSKLHGRPIVDFTVSGCIFSPTNVIGQHTHTHAFKHVIDEQARGDVAFDAYYTRDLLEHGYGVEIFAERDAVAFDGEHFEEFNELRLENGVIVEYHDGVRVLPVAA